MGRNDARGGDIVWFIPATQDFCSNPLAFQVLLGKVHRAPLP